MHKVLKSHSFLMSFFPSKYIFSNFLKLISVFVCIRDQLTRVLQQIKSERGTMAGMSIDDLTQQVALRLAQNQKPVCNQKVLISLIHNVFLLFVSFCALPVSFLTLSLL